MDAVDAVDANVLASSFFGLQECLPWTDAARRSAKARDVARIPVSIYDFKFGWERIASNPTPEG